MINNKMIKQLSLEELQNALPMIWKIFCKYEAINYQESGKRAFWEAIHSEKYLNLLNAYGAFDNDELIGIIATRNAGSHIALFFVDGPYQNQGIGTVLWNTILDKNTSVEITVHSSLYAVDIYKDLGFKQMDDVQDSDGIQYVPMIYNISIK